MMRWRWIATLLVFVSYGSLLAQSPLEQFFTQHCVKCHGPKKQMGKVRLDRSLDAIFSDAELLETVVSVLEAGEMPP
ncbi:MAG: c-type cytochrome domain-containing protein, partial [Pirellulaceae bacterium]